MPQNFSSPGVNANEVDQSFIEAGAPQVGAILIGRTPKGAAFLPVIVSNMDQFQANFGNLDPTMQVTYAAQNYLKSSNSLMVIRVLGNNDGTGISNGYTLGSIIGITDTSGANATTGSILAVLHTTGVFGATQVTGVAGDANRFQISFRRDDLVVLFSATASFLTGADDFVGKVLNSDPTKFSTYGHYVYQTFPYKTQAISASWSPVTTFTPTNTSFTRSFDQGRSAWVKSQPIGGQEFDLFRFHTLGRGRASNNDVKVQIVGVRPPTAPNVYPYGTFDVLVRDFNDTDQRPVVLERYAQLNLDPASPNYLPRRIGDRWESFDTTTRKFVVLQGLFPNKSSKVFVETVQTYNPNANVPSNALPWGFRGYTREQFSGSTVGNGAAFGIANVPSIPYTPGQFNAQCTFDQNISWGGSFVSGGIVDRMRALPDGELTAFVTSSDADFSLRNLSGSYVNGNLRYSYTASWYTNSSATGSGPNNGETNGYIPIYASASLHQFTMPFFGGIDGFDIRVADPLYLQNSDTDASSVGVISLKRAIDCVANPDVVDGNLLVIPGINNLMVTDYARALANKRMDMMYVMDVSGSTRAEAIANLNARSLDDNYSACYYPDVMINDVANSRRFRAAPSTVVIGALAYTDRVAQAFFAPAGLNRGGLSLFGVDDIVDRIDHDDRDALYDNKINPITRFPGEGVVIFGQKTLQLRPSALDRVNVRRLLILAKRAVIVEARRLVFEPNNGSTWTRFVNKVNPILEGYRKDQGINRFKVIMDKTTNPSDVIDRNEMKGKIFLEPVKAAEFITIDFVISPSGVSFGS